MMPEKTPEKKQMWKYVKILGIVVLVLGVALLGYSAYTLLAGPASYSQHAFTMNATARAAFNATRAAAGARLNQSRYTAIAATGAYGARGGMGNVLSGILLILLGALLFKYAQLKETIRLHTSKK